MNIYFSVYVCTNVVERCLWLV